MSSIRSFIGEMETLDQEKFNKSCQTLIDRMKKDREPDEVIQKAILEYEGGTCLICNTAYKKEKVFIKKDNKVFADYEYYKPACFCFEEKKSVEALKDDLKEKLFSANIPEKYHDARFDKWDYSIEKRTTEAMKRVFNHNYVKPDLYNESERSLVLYGDVGTGKTFSGISLLIRYVLEVKEINVIFVPCADIVSNTINNKEKDYIQSVIDFDVIMLDDIDKIYIQQDWIRERIFSLIDGLISKNKMIVCTTNIKDPTEFQQKFGDALTSRIIGNCELIKFEGKDYRLLNKVNKLKRSQKND